MTTVHVVRSCPYWRAQDVWLHELTNDGLENLLARVSDPDLCESCMAVVNTPPMIKADGNDDGRMIWHVHCTLRQALRSALNEAAYELVDTDGFTALYRGPSATVTVEWNRTWWTGGAA